MLDKYAAYFSSTVGMALAAVCAALAVFATVQTLRISSWRGDYTTLEAKSEKDKAQLTLDASVHKQEASKWKDASAAMQSAVDKSKQETEARDGVIKNLIAANALLASKTDTYIKKLKEYKPPEGSTDCGEAMAQVQNLAKEVSK
jgi:ATPase subunit of ABC transporter with duplicated ATPase domains